MDYLEELETAGVVIIPSVLGGGRVASLRAELVRAIAEDEVSHPDVFDAGMVHNCMFRGPEMASVLDSKAMNDIVGSLLTQTFIVYAYQSSSLNAGQENYGSRVHVDSPRFIPGYSTNVGVIFPLDDFTLDNGATYYLPGSHKASTLPSDEYFYENAKRAVCKAGDMIVFDGRLVHAAGSNSTRADRHSLTINFCRSYMRQRFDFPKMVTPKILEMLSPNAQKLLGWNVRMPSSLGEFYLPEDQRLYKSGQG